MPGIQLQGLCTVPCSVTSREHKASCLSAAHCKSSMFGCSLNIPITDGRFNLGTWQVGAALT